MNMQIGIWYYLRDKELVGLAALEDYQTMHSIVV